jgi:hypothetical protein
LARENELRELFDRRKLIEERRERLFSRARERFARHAAKVPENMKLNPGEVGTCLTLGIIPRFPSRTLCNPEDLVKIVPDAQVSWRSGRFPRSIDRSVSQHESVITLAAAIRQPSIFEVNVWGTLFYGSAIEGKHHDSVGIHLGEFVGHILVFLHHAAGMMKAFGYSGSLAIEVGLSGIREVDWVWDAGGYPEPRDGSVLDDSVYFSLAAAGENLTAEPDTIAALILRVALFSMGWPKIVSTPAETSNLIRLGYVYNYWPADTRVSKSR